MNYGYYNNGSMGSLEKKLIIVAIRAAAKDLAGDLGQCNDFQIIFCASAKKLITSMCATLEDASDEDLRSLYKWMITDEGGSCYVD